MCIRLPAVCLTLCCSVGVLFRCSVFGGVTVVLVICFAVARMNRSTGTWMMNYVYCYAWSVFLQYGVMCVMQCVWYDVIPFWWCVCPQWVVCFG